MQVTGWIKRVLPFVATFAVGVFIASFFVDIGASRDRCRRGKKHPEMQRLAAENDALKNENLRLRNQLDNLESWQSEHLVPHGHGVGDGDGIRVLELPETGIDGLPAPPAVPPRPVAPKAAK